MKRFIQAISFGIVLLIFFMARTGLAAEPAMADYTHYPIFQVNSVQPNILIMLDNSGSMNFNAYGSWPGNGGTVTDAPFMGEPLHVAALDSQVSQASDDAEEDAAGSVYDHSDLDLGKIPVGMCFQNLSIPQGAIITKAYITFKAAPLTNGTNGATSLTFHGQAVDDAPTFQIGSVNDITGRAETDAAVNWGSVPAWTENETYQSPDLSPILQEIVDRDGWSSGNAVVVKVTGSGTREAKAYSDGPTLHVEYRPVSTTRYYGYFNPDYFYYWNTNKFDHKYKKIAYEGDPASGGHWNVVDLSGNSHALPDSEIVSSELWDGNWLNWLSMRRIDVLRKVLMGGLSTARTGGGNQTNYGETPDQATRTFIKEFDTTNSSAVSPYDGDYHYGMKDGYIYVDDDSDPFSGQIARFTIAIQKNIQYDPEDFYNYDSGDNLAGVLQKVGNKARWGNEWFNTGTGNNESGGTIAATIGTNMVSLVTDLQNTGCDTWTPLAESYYVAMQYFKQEDPASGLDYPNHAVPNANDGQDPYYNGTEFVECADSFVILLTDGASTKDSNIPDALKSTDPDGTDNTACDEDNNTNCDYPSGGTDYLDDVALYARTHDLRSDLDGDQNLILYTIYAFGNDSNAENLLKDAAKNGGFDDRNGNNLPDLQVEWDKDNDGNPDTYYKADNGYELERKLIKAINDILARAAAGSAVSVLATTGEGEGNMYQAYFRPVVPVGTEEVDWVGYMQSLWVDPQGNLREDTNSNLKLDLDSDKIVSFFLDAASGNTMIKRYDVSSTTPYPDLATASYETISLSDIDPVWEAGSVLSQTSPDDRNIFTYLDKNNDGQVDETTDDPLDDSGEVVSLDAGSAAAIKPFLGVKDNTTWSYLGVTQDDRVNNLINFTRGTDISGLRPRTIDGSVWKLGDIVYSTPVPVSKPVENYHIIYSDESYQLYLNTYKDRETVVYVGANDGMLHAFTSWKYNPTTNAYTKPSGAPSLEDIGQELWAYIPQTLLPHLKWLASPDYTHVDYVDLKPKVFDAKILPDDTHYTDSDSDDNWGTFVLVGLNMGGKHIWSDDDFDYDSGTADTVRNFYPSYSLIDVTDPRNPRLIWERSYQDLEMTTSFPAVVKVKDKWFAVFGSGPMDYDGTSTKHGHIFVVDLKTGVPYKNGANDWLFETYEAKAFMSSPSSLDKNLNFSVDGIYIGETYLSGSWKGKLYKVDVPAMDGSGNYDDTSAGNYVDNPNDTTYPWLLKRFFDSPRPITSPVALSVDHFDNTWIYVGTGRYISTADKSTTDTQYMFGIKDPFYNASQHTGDGYFHDYTSELELRTSDLFDGDPYVITVGGNVYKTDDSYFGEYSNMLTLARGYDGWIRSLSVTGERIVSKFAILGGIVFTPSFVPNQDICGFGGESYLYGQYYETGTAYYKPVFNSGTSSVTIDEEVFEKVLDKIRLGEGKASAVGVHVGTKGAKALIQQSTGTVLTETLHPAFNIKSGLRSWQEK